MCFIRFMISQPHRGADRGSYIIGKSIHSQRVERLKHKIFYADWTLLQKFSISGGNYETMRRRGSYLGIAVYFCPPHKSCTEIFADSWNVHPLSSEKNRSSEQLWILWRNIQKRELCTYEVIFILIPHVKRFHTVFRFLVST